MRHRESFARLMSLIVTGMSLVGCASDPPQADRYHAGQGVQGNVSVMPNYYVDLTLPNVVIEDGSTRISGTVRRKPGIRWTLTGRVDIEFVSAEGQILDGLPALIVPGTVSMDPNTPSTYSTSYGYVPPNGSTIRVRFVDADTAAREDLEGNDFYGPVNDNAGHATGGLGGKGGHGADHYGLGHHGGGFGAGFGHM